MSNFVKPEMDSKIKLPAISDYALHSLPHPGSESVAKIEETETFMKEILAEFPKKEDADSSM